MASRLLQLIHLDPAQVVTESKQLAHRLRWKTKDVDASGYARFVTRVSIWSWGEEVTVDADPSGVVGTKVRVESRPRFQLSDWGRSKRNVRRLAEALTRADVERATSAGSPSWSTFGGNADATAGKGDAGAGI